MDFTQLCRTRCGRMKRHFPTRQDASFSVCRVRAPPHSRQRMDCFFCTPSRCMRVSKGEAGPLPLSCQLCHCRDRIALRSQRLSTASRHLRAHARHIAAATRSRWSQGTGAADVWAETEQEWCDSLARCRSPCNPSRLACTTMGASASCLPPRPSAARRTPHDVTNSRDCGATGRGTASPHPTREALWRPVHLHLTSFDLGGGQCDKPIGVRAREKVHNQHSPVCTMHILQMYIYTCTHVRGDSSQAPAARACGLQLSSQTSSNCKRLAAPP